MRQDAAWKLQAAEDRNDPGPAQLEAETGETETTETGATQASSFWPRGDGCPEETGATQASSFWVKREQPVFPVA